MALTRGSLTSQTINDHESLQGIPLVPTLNPYNSNNFTSIKNKCEELKQKSH